MSQTPNLENPKTLADYTALTDLLKAKLAALEAQKELTKAQAADDPVAAQLAAATQAASLAAQRKALSDSQAAILKNQFAVPDSGYTGEVKAGDKAGNIEAAMLAAGALNRASEIIVGKVKDLVAKKEVVLVGGSDLPDFQPLIAYRAQLKLISNSMEKSISNLDAPIAAANQRIPSMEAVTPAAVGLALDAANKLLGFFRTDYSIQGVSVTTDDLLLISALSENLTQKAGSVSMPAVYNAKALDFSIDAPSPVITELTGLTDSRVQLQQKVDYASASADKLTALAGDLTAEAKSESDETKMKALLGSAAELTKVSADLKSAGDKGKAAISLYDGMLTKLTTPDEKAKLPLAVIIQLQSIRDRLSGGALLMSAKISSVGGSCYTKKNMWTFFGQMPFYVMGGAVVNFTLFDGTSGKVLSAGAIPVDGGFFKVDKVAERFPLRKTH